MKICKKVPSIVPHWEMKPYIYDSSKIKKPSQYKEIWDNWFISFQNESDERMSLPLFRRRVKGFSKG